MPVTLYLTYLALLAGLMLACAAFARQGRRVDQTVLLLVATVMVAFLWYWSEPRSLLSDFYKGYYFGGAVVRENPAVLYDEAPPPGLVGVPGFVQYVNIPVVAVAFVPFAAMPPVASGVVATILGLCAIAVAFFVLVSLARLSTAQAWLLACLFAANGPLINSLREGNGTHFVLAGLALSFYWVREARPVLAGGVLALCTVLKPPLAILALALLLARQWQGLFAFAATGGTICLVSLVAFGVDLHLTWYERIVVPLQQHPLGAFNVQSMDGFLARLLEGGEYLTRWSPIPNVSSWFMPLRVLLLSLLWGSVLVTRWMVRRTQPDGLLALDASVLLTLSVLAGPVSWSHYYALLLLPLAVLLRTWSPESARPWRQPGLVVLGALLVSLPVLQPESASGVWGAVVARVLLSHYFIGGGCVFVALLMAQRRLAMSRLMAPTEGVFTPAGPVRHSDRDAGVRNHGSAA